MSSAAAVVTTQNRQSLPARGCVEPFSISGDLLKLQRVEVIEMRMLRRAPRPEAAKPVPACAGPLLRNLTGARSRTANGRDRVLGQHAVPPELHRVAQEDPQPTYEDAFRQMRSTVLLKYAVSTSPLSKEDPGYKVSL